MRDPASHDRQSSLRALTLLALTGVALLVSACQDPISRYDHSPRYQQQVRQDLEQDKKGNGCLKC